MQVQKLSIFEDNRTNFHSCSIVFLEISASGPPVVTLFNVTRLITASVIGIVFDLLMMKFLSKRNESKRSQSPKRDRLVPWKSGPQEKTDLTIPVGATLVNTVGIIFCK